MGSSSCFVLSCLIATVILPQAFPTTTVHRWGSPCSSKGSEWVYLGGNLCYNIVMNTSVNWMDAVYDCFQKGGSLASFHSSEEVKRVLRYIKDYGQPLHIGLWEQSDGTFQWIDGSELDLRNWEREEMDSDEMCPIYDSQKHKFNYVPCRRIAKGRQEICAALNTLTGKWNPIPGWKRYGYICSALKAVPDIYPRQPNKVCPKGATEWRDFGVDYCYIIEKEHETTWHGALRGCSEKGGSLASFHSIEEVSVVLQYHKEYTMQYNKALYIGLQQKDDGTFEWVDGSPLNYENWFPGEPNDPEEKCGELMPIIGKFNDNACDRLSGYVCSILKVASPSGSMEPPKSPQVKILEGQDMYVGVGGCISLTCVIMDIPEPPVFIFWYLDDILLNYDISRNSSITVQKEENTAISILRIDGAQSDDSGNYKCSPSNAESVSVEINVVKDFSESGICGGDMFSENGTLHSSNYPGNYLARENCLWNITVPENYRVALNFEKVEVEYGDNCKYDYIEVLDGHETGTAVLRRLCGLQEPETLLSSGNKMGIKFVSNRWHQSAGFFAYFFRVERCSKDIEAEEGVLQSRNYPDDYWPNDVCTWKITVPEDYGIVLKFQAFDVEMRNDCRSDYLEVRDGHDSTSPILGRFCGFGIPGDIRSSGHKVTVTFVSDYSEEYSGFHAEFGKDDIISTGTFTQQTGDICGGNIISESGILHSPNYPKKYGSQSKCTWRITIPDDYQIVLRFKTFTLERRDETSQNCESDYVEVRDGLDSTSPVLGRYCGKTIPNDTISSGNKLTVEFVSDRSKNYAGFSATFNKGNITNLYPEAFWQTGNVTNSTEESELQTSSHCEDCIFSDRGVILSPNYPDKYGPDARYIWRIRVAENHQVVLRFLSFKIDRHSECNYDYVKILDGQELNSSLLGKFCGYDIPEDIRSSGNKLTVVFKSDSSQEYDGFAAEFKEADAVVTQEPIFLTEICGTNLVSDNGTLNSPNYPDNYLPMLNCVWNIILQEEEEQIILQFESFDVEHDKDCKFDFVEVLDGVGSDVQSLGTFCGQHIPDVLRSSDNKMTVKFATDDSFQRNGFFATFTKSGCRKSIIAERGTIETPNYPQNYRANENCTWKITVPENYQVALEFETLSVEYFGHCNSDYVKIFDGHSRDSPFLGQFCGNEVPEVVRSSNNKMTVTFKSDNSHERQGFSAKFEKVQPELVLRDGTSKKTRRNHF